MWEWTLAEKLAPPRAVKRVGVMDAMTAEYSVVAMGGMTAAWMAVSMVVR